MIPDFIISAKGRVTCKSHSEISLLEEKPPEVKDYDSYRENLNYTKSRISLNTCKSCNHYVNNTCTVPKEKLRNIMSRLKLRRYKCKFCGHSINSLYNVIYQQQAEEKHNVTLPLLCCDCFDMLRKGKAERTGKAWLKHYCASVLVFCIPLIVIPWLTVLVFETNVTMLLIVLIPTLIVGLIPFIFDYKSRKKLQKSIKNSDLLKELQINGDEK